MSAEPTDEPLISRCRFDQQNCSNERICKRVKDSNISDIVRPPNWNDAVSLVGSMPSAESTGELDDVIAKYVADGLMELPDRKYGEWVDGDGMPSKAMFSVYCSECGNWSEYRSDYCGSCGAIMKGKTNGK